MAKKYYMVLDTETITDARVPYDTAWIIVDRAGHQVDRFDGLASEVFDNATMRYILRNDDFAKRKASFYLDYRPAYAQIMPFSQIMQHTNNALSYYNATVVAYNAAFDTKVLNDYAMTLFNHKFFDVTTPIWDLWNMALNVICDSKNYVQWCKAANFVTDKGNIKSSAESVFSYLSGIKNFEEEHTALADCEIEAQILQTVFKRKRKLHTGMCGFVSRQPVWQKRLQK